MFYRFACAIGAGLLLSAAIGDAAPRGGLVPGATSADLIAPTPIANRHGSTSSARSSSARSSSAGSRPSGSSASAGRRWSASPAHRAQVIAPYRTNIAPRATFSTPFAGRPHGRFARRLIPLGALSAIYIGSRYYYPYRYMPYDGPVCTGMTENGCPLQWMEVPTENAGDATWQCVEFCPQE